MWDIGEIKKQKKYCLTRLSNNNLSEAEKNKLKLSINSYIYMLDSSGTLCYTIFPKVVDILSNGKYSLYRKNKYDKLLNIKTSGSVEYNEMIFLVDLLIKLADSGIDYKKGIFNKIDINSDELMNVAMKYYEDFPDKEISHLALDVLKNTSNMNFTKNMRYKKEWISGNMYMDYTFNRTYVNIYIHSDINDYNSIVHEVMHCVDHLFNSKIPTNYHNVVSEIPGYTSDFLFIDYLDNIELDGQEIEKLRKQKIFNVFSLVNGTYDIIKQNYYNINGVEITDYTPVELIVSTLTPQVISKLLQIKAVIVSYGLYMQIKENQINGFDNFKKYMKTGKPIETDLEFDYIELSNNKLMQITEKFINYSKEIVNTSKLTYR